MSFRSQLLATQRLILAGTVLDNPVVPQNSADTAPIVPQDSTDIVSDSTPSVDVCENPATNADIPIGHKDESADNLAAPVENKEESKAKDNDTSEKPCSYCSAQARHLVLHTKNELEECLASRPSESNEPAKLPEELEIERAATCSICGSLWTSHSESAYVACKEIIEQSNRALSEHELDVIKQFDNLVCKLESVEVNYILIRDYFQIPNNKLTDEERRQKIGNFQKLYKIARIAEDCHQVKKTITLTGEDSEDFKNAIRFSGDKKKRSSTPKEKLSPKERQIKKWIDTLNIPLEKAEEMWNLAYGKD